MKIFLITLLLVIQTYSFCIENFDTDGNTINLSDSTNPIGQTFVASSNCSLVQFVLGKDDNNILYGTLYVIEGTAVTLPADPLYVQFFSSADAGNLTVVFDWPVPLLNGTTYTILLHSIIGSSAFRLASTKSIGAAVHDGNVDSLFDFQVSLCFQEVTEIPSFTSTPSATPTVPSTVVETLPSATPSPTAFSWSPSPSVNITKLTETPSNTPTPSPSSSVTPSPSQTPSPSRSPSRTPSQSRSPSPSPSVSATPTPSRTPSRSATPSRSPSRSPSVTPSVSATPSSTSSPSSSTTPSPSSTPSTSKSPSASPSASSTIITQPSSLSASSSSSPSSNIPPVSSSPGPIVPSQSPQSTQTPTPSSVAEASLTPPDPTPGSASPSSTFKDDASSLVPFDVPGGPVTGGAVSLATVVSFGLCCICIAVWKKKPQNEEDATEGGADTEILAREEV